MYDWKCWCSEAKSQIFRYYTNTHGPTCKYYVTSMKAFHIYSNLKNKDTHSTSGYRFLYNNDAVEVWCGASIIAHSDNVNM